MSRRARSAARPAVARRPPRLHVMVPVDLSDRNARALRMALDLARPGRGTVTLLHVIQRVPGIAPGELDAFYQRLVRSSERQLGRTARTFAERGLDVRTEVRVGDPAAEIVRAAQRERVSLVVMGSHRVRRGDRRRGWGTTSYKVGIFCRCPILLVK